MDKVSKESSEVSEEEAVTVEAEQVDSVGVVIQQNAVLPDACTGEEFDNDALRQYEKKEEGLTQEARKAVKKAGGRYTSPTLNLAMPRQN